METFCTQVIFGPNRKSQILPALSKIYKEYEWKKKKKEEKSKKKTQEGDFPIIVLLLCYRNSRQADMEQGRSRVRGVNTHFKFS